jgi:hypothetical protein
VEAKVTKPFKGTPDGKIYPEKFEPGDTVTGDLARVAVEEGWAKSVKGSEAAPIPAKEPAAGEQGETSGPDKTQPQETKPSQGQSKKGKKR